MMKESIKKAEGEMQKVLEFLKKEFSALRAGRASASLLDGVIVSAYNSRLPLNQVATITTPQPNLIVIQPWDKSLVSEISKAVLASNLGLNPIADPTGIKLPIPPLSEERRKEVIKVAHKVAEQGRVEIREVRRRHNEELKKLEKEKKIAEDDLHHGTAEVQKLTDNLTKEIDRLLSAKEKEILE
ncbi:MAG: ribosome recycling factor [Candidatus Omnitrophota bacterium]